ncbi:hypothetical protein ACWNT8_04785 [Pigmentibacter ruber]|uniref:hypothetical protein n=1 Tax=Pigmentibacter ruber TaxID=2683196 RepID=UPI00131C4DEC|nr:hypothetical protein [Pigmentibacter ruber]BFD33424.1 hypothetical protein GTC16762_30420 [Pigmentibacter ruber]
MVNVAVIDDEEFYINIWKSSLENNCNSYYFNDPDEFLDKHLDNLNFFDYIIADVMYGSRNILKINFSKILRKHKYTKDIILYSNYKQNFIDLENSHYYDLSLAKDNSYSLDELKSLLISNRIRWKERLVKQGIKPVIN